MSLIALYLLLPRVFSHGSAPAQSSAYTITDVSPDQAYGLADGGSNSGGRIISVVADPTDRNIAYAASEYAGVWKTTTAGRSWVQSSIGFTCGPTLKVAHPLAIEPIIGRNLMFLSNPNDYRTMPKGGLYVSPDAGGHWTPKPLRGAVTGNAFFVVDSAGASHGCVLTTAGVEISGPNSAVLGRWRRTRCKEFQILRPDRGER